MTHPTTTLLDITDVWTPHHSLMVNVYFLNTVARMWDFSTFSETQYALPLWEDVQQGWKNNLKVIQEDKFTPDSIKARINAILVVHLDDDVLLSAKYLVVKQSSYATRMETVIKDSVSSMKRVLENKEALVRYASKVSKNQSSFEPTRQEKRQKKKAESLLSSTVSVQQVPTKVSVATSSSSSSPSSPSSSSTSPSFPSSAVITAAPSGRLDSPTSTSSASLSWVEDIKRLGKTLLGYHVHNTMVHIDMKDENIAAMVKVVADSSFHNSPDLEKALNNFYVIKELSLLNTMLAEVAKIYLCGGDRELAYIWHMLEKLHVFWHDGIDDQPWEGWFNVHFFGPMLEVIRRIPGITEVTTECHSLGSLYLRSQRIDVDRKRNFIMRHKDLGIDVLVTEGKPGAGAKKDEHREDAGKIRVAMAANLLHTISQVPHCKQNEIRDLRTFGILMSGTNVYLMEGRVASDHLILIYVVAVVEIPMDIHSIEKALHLVKQLICFARRIQQQVRIIPKVLAAAREEVSFSHLETIGIFV
ncbi:hypothetical protein BGZ76_000388 [Entomortierella beljakovae]|nr:hypothetical protein BGZ76_000388 [Entomortierella beljakovae]